MEGWKDYVGKKVYIETRSNRQYTCEIVSIDDKGNGLIFINTIDKFGSKITFATGEISLIQEEKA